MKATGGYVIAPPKLRMSYKMQYNQLLSQRTQHMQANALREILKVVAQPGMISLAGGLPAPESFPIALIEQLTHDAYAEFGVRTLQYDVTEGFGPLREALIGYLAWIGIQAQLEQVIVFSGSQSALDTIGKILITPGDLIAIEAPSYIGAISAFNAYQPTYVSLPTDEYGLIPAALDEVLRQNTVKFIYLVPTFQNPTGRTLLLERRQQVAAIIQRHGALVIEDDPYSLLRYSGDAVPPLHQFAPENVMYSSTFSKVLAPAFRIGFVVAPAPLARWLVIAKQAADLHTQTLGQAIAALYLAGEHLQAHLPRIIDLYRPRRDAMVAALAAHFSSDFRWNNPDGGMFLWLEGPDGLDCEALYWEAVKQNIAFVPGTYFYFDNTHRRPNTMRLNFTMANEAMIQQAVRTLSQVAADFMAKAHTPQT